MLMNQIFVLPILINLFFLQITQTRNICSRNDKFNVNQLPGTWYWNGLYQTICVYGACVIETTHVEGIFEIESYVAYGDDRQVLESYLIRSMKNLQLFIKDLNEHRIGRSVEALTCNNNNEIILLEKDIPFYNYFSKNSSLPTRCIEMKTKHS